MFSLSTTHSRPRICYLSVIDTFAPTVPREDKNPVSLAEAPKSQKEHIKSSISADLHSLESEVTSKKISTILKGKFDSLGLSFDVAKFEKTMQESLNSVMGNPDIPFIAKRKFLEDVNSKVDLLSSVTPADIENLKTQRNVMSLGVEAMELSGKSEKEKQAFYLNKIVTETIGKYITPTALGLIEAFSGDQTRIGEVSYQKNSLDAYSAGIVSLDTKYGLSMKGVLDHLHKNSTKQQSDLMTDGISREMRNTIISDLAGTYPTFAAKPSIQTIIATLKVNPSFQIRYTPDMVVDIAGQKVAIKDIIEDYRKVNATWQGSEHEIRDARDIALADGTIAKMKNKLGMDQLKSEFDHLTPENIEAKMKNASLADMIIMATQLAQIIPIVGDIGGGSLDLAGAITGISTDGAKMSTLERSLSGVFGALGITVFGGWLNRARNAGKLAGLAKMLPLMQRYLPEKIETFVKRGGKTSEETRNGIIKFANMMGEEFAQQIEGIIRKNGTIPSFVSQPKTKEMKNIQQGLFLATKGEIKQSGPESIFYSSHFSNEIPESLRSQNPMAWIDKSGEIHYNKTFLEEKFGIKITTENGKTLFDGKTLRYHKKAPEILDFLKELKAHEVTHRILEATGITEIKAGGKIYTQEDICSIVDGSKKITKEELTILERILRERLGEDFNLLKNGDIDADALRRFDTKMVAKGGDFSRKTEAARGSLGMYEKIQTSTVLSSELIATALSDDYSLAPEILRKYKQLKNNPIDIPGLSDEVVIKLLFSSQPSSYEKMYIGESFLNNLDCFNIKWDSELGYSLIRLGKEYTSYAQNVSRGQITGDFAIAMIKSGNIEGLFSLSLSKNIDFNSAQFREIYNKFKSGGDYSIKNSPEEYKRFFNIFQSIDYKSQEKVLDILRAYSPKNIEGMKNNLRVGIKNIDGFSTGREGAIAQLFVELERDFGIKIDARMSNNDIYILLPEVFKSDKTFIDDFFLLLNFERFNFNGGQNIDLGFMSPELSRRIGNNIEFLKKNAIHNPNAKHSSMGKYLKLYMSENIGQDYDVFKQFVLDGKFGEFGKIVYGFFDHHSSNSSLKDFVKLDSFKVGSYGEHTSYRAKNYMIYKDMIQIALKSNSEGLLNIIKNLEGGDMIAQKVKNGQTLLESENLLLNDYYNNIGLLLHAIGYPGIKDINIRHFGYGKTYDQMLQILGAKGSQSLSDRTVEICFGMLGFKDLKSIQLEMARFKQISQTKGVDFYNSIAKNGGHIQFQEGDLVRAFDSKHLDGDIKNGQFSGEMILNSRYADNTRFDLDMVVLGKEDLIGGFNKDFSEATSGGPSSKSDLSQYGDIKMVIRKEYADANFIKAGSNYSLPTTSRKVGEYIKDNRRELNYNYVQFKNQVGIRTGVSINEVDYFIVQTTDQEKLNTLFKTFAKNGVYIPIVDENGKVIFTPEMFESLQVLPN